MHLFALCFVLLTLATLWGHAQTTLIETKWAAVRRLEAQPTTLARDTTLVRAYADFALDMVTKESADSGLVYAEKAYTLANTGKWIPGILLALTRKASCQNIANQHFDALQTGLQGLQLAEQHQDGYYQAMFHRSLGNNYDMLDKYDQAIPHYERCLQLTKGVPALQLTRGHALVELGDAYRFYYKNPVHAKALIEQAIGIYAAHDSSVLGYGYDYYGQTLTDLKLYRQAEQAFARSEQYYRQFGKTYLLPELLLHEAELYVAMKDYNRAITKAGECMLVSQQQRSFYGQRGAYRVLYEASKATGKSADALVNHEFFMALNDSVNATNCDLKFQGLRADYELQTQKTLNQALTIRQQQQTQWLLVAGVLALLIFSGYVFYNNRQLRQKTQAILAAQLQGQTLERQRVAADLHDNLGTTLSALHWNLEAMDKSQLTITEQAVYTSISQQVGQAYNDVRLLAHNLLPDELAKQGLAVALRNLVGKLNRNTKGHFSLTGADTLPRFDPKTEFEVYSICLELLNNTLKHASATEGVIELARENDNLYLTVSDNGTGLGQQEEKEGRGLQNVAARVQSLAGTWSVDSEPAKGVRHQITVPVKAMNRVG